MGTSKLFLLVKFLYGFHQALRQGWYSRRWFKRTSMPSVLHNVVFNAIYTLAISLCSYLLFSFVLAMAGNIIPAIATTNAIISGVIVMQALNILNGKLEKCKTVSFHNKNIVQAFRLLRD